MSRIGINTKSINDGQVGTSDLANSAVTSAKIASPLANLSVTSLTAGGLSYPTSDGTDGQFLTTDGSGTLSFSTGATGKTFTVTNSGSAAYSFTGSGTGESSANSNPTLYLTRGETYTFSLNASGHPFYIKTVNGTGTGNQYANGVSGQGTQVGNITFTVPMNAPKKLYYNCSVHGSMNGTIYIPSHKDIDASTFQTKSDSVTSNNALLSLIEDRMQVANVQPLLDNYLQVANSTGFITQSTLDNYLQVANSTSFATTSQLDNYLQVANSSTAGTNTSVVYTYANFLGG
jgi:plastocyanin